MWETMNPQELPEVAFVGRSNVGKSSLLNALLRSRLARTSKTPGRTRSADYYSVCSQPPLRLVDLPGYGFSRVGESARNELHDLIATFIENRLQRGVLKHVCVLLDSRRGFGAMDTDLMQVLDGMGMQYGIVLTKADAVRPRLFQAAIEEVSDIGAMFRHVDDTFFAVSSKLGYGVDQLRAGIVSLAAGESS